MSDASVQIFHPSVIYQDDRAALDWLAKAFGFEVSLIVEDKGQIVHAEMKYRDALVTIARAFMDATRSPKALGGKITQLLHVQVDGDIDAHCARARTYRAIDPEGHVWVFAQEIKAMSLADMEKASGLKLRETL
jgi:uncharacterized glyoxalase superfamily protein PhnB